VSQNKLLAGGDDRVSGKFGAQRFGCADREGGGDENRGGDDSENDGEAHACERESVIRLSG
jgi:hypothetical protein